MKTKAKEKILKAAKTLLNKKEINRIYIHDILGEAGVCLATFYKHFESKREMFIKLWAVIEKELKEEIKNNKNQYNEISTDNLFSIFEKKLEQDGESFRRMILFYLVELSKNKQEKDKVHFVEVNFAFNTSRRFY